MGQGRLEGSRAGEWEDGRRVGGRVTSLASRPSHHVPRVSGRMGGGWEGERKEMRRGRGAARERETRGGRAGKAVYNGLKHDSDSDSDSTVTRKGDSDSGSGCNSDTY